MTSTSAPSRDQTEPSSRPITPAPMTTMRLGTLPSSRAPVELTIFFSSISTPGSGVDSEPVAIRIDFVCKLSVPPSASATATSPALGIEPSPFT